MEIIKSTSTLDDIIKTLIERSVDARERAYCHYSKFPVGCALLCEDGSIVTGCNVENVSFGLTVCAERTAVCKAVSEGKLKFKMVAVSAVNKEILTGPCGACRQFLAEFNPRIPIYLYNPETKEVGITSLAHLLPFSFNPENVTFD